MLLGILLDLTSPVGRGGRTWSRLVSVSCGVTAQWQTQFVHAEGDGGCKRWLSGALSNALRISILSQKRDLELWGIFSGPRYQALNVCGQVGPWWMCGAFWDVSSSGGGRCWWWGVR